MNRLRQEREWLARVQVRSQANSPNSLYFFNPLLARAGKGEGPREVRAAMSTMNQKPNREPPRVCGLRARLALANPATWILLPKPKSRVGR